jgi:hypothetical protein
MFIGTRVFSICRQVVKFIRADEEGEQIRIVNNKLAADYRCRVQNDRT